MKMVEENLLDRLDLDLRHVHVASERDILNLHARHVANDFLDVRDFHRNILDLNLGNLCFFFSCRWRGWRSRGGLVVEFEIRKLWNIDDC